MEAKFVSLEKEKIKSDLHLSRRFFIKEQSGAPFLTTKNEEILEELEVEQAEEKIRTYKSNSPQ
jgi:hypothetical protein